MREEKIDFSQQQGKQRLRKGEKSQENRFRDIKAINQQILADKLKNRKSIWNMHNVKNVSLSTETEVQLTQLPSKIVEQTMEIKISGLNYTPAYNNLIILIHTIY